MFPPDPGKGQSKGQGKGQGKSQGKGQGQGKGQRERQGNAKQKGPRQRGLVECQRMSPYLNQKNPYIFPHQVSQKLTPPQQPNLPNLKQTGARGNGIALFVINN